MLQANYKFTILFYCYSLLIGFHENKLEIKKYEYHVLILFLYFRKRISKFFLPYKLIKFGFGLLKISGNSVFEIYPHLISIFFYMTNIFCHQTVELTDSWAYVFISVFKSLDSLCSE